MEGAGQSKNIFSNFSQQNVNRGNYEETVNREGGAGRIKGLYDEQ